MTFLQPLLLWALPLAALPILIHLIHLHRRRTIPWAAMMFLFAAQKMNKGFTRLRQWLILALRTLAVLALLFMIARPLAGGWLGLTGGSPDTVLILLDRSASMEQINPLTGSSKRHTGLQKLAAAMQETYRDRSQLILIDSATLTPIPLTKAAQLPDLPQTAATSTTADLPSLLQAALDHITTNQTGRTDLWILSDLQSSDWDPSSGRWENLRTAFATLPGLRFHLLAYPQPAQNNLSITLENLTRRQSTDKAELLLDLRIARHDTSTNLNPIELPLRFVINGTATTTTVTLKEQQRELLLQGHNIPLDQQTTRGWGRIELPNDTQPADNIAHFAFDQPPVLHSVIITDTPEETAPLQAILTAPADPLRRYSAQTFPSTRSAEIDWETTALIVWQSPLPAADTLIAKQLQNHLAAGHTLLFLPPESEIETSTTPFLNLTWGPWQTSPTHQTQSVEWWRTDTGPLANTRDGKALPLGELEILRHRQLLGESATPFARLANQHPLLLRANTDQTQNHHAWFLTTLPGSGSSTLARDGVNLFALLHRLLNDGARTLGKTQQRIASLTALGDEPLTPWTPLSPTIPITPPYAIHDGIYTSTDRLIALNRPPAEDHYTPLPNSTLDELFKDLDHRRIEDNLENQSSLTSEIWRTLLFVMALFLIAEALLCLPQKEKATKPIPA
ncbi:hypothetical protein FEM03_09675 [Phragmitibacter flavus]|uniref:Aerotolerance regulator N-terminal domain-containing protein n=1 Tax=Phragmitibacter flavus TaxID=2576071 RepID=A0A5R8KFV1_9BACT|nr:BatA domain-containing protein [Phragmitibacter flavus]TLD71166.1 hypothetical protein FEM03_09675 [Phragmitibacter flavus]